MDSTELTRLRLVIRSLVRDQSSQLMRSAQWDETDAYRQLSPADQASVRNLERGLRRSNGEIEALLPGSHIAEWC